MQAHLVLARTPLVAVTLAVVALACSDHERETSVFAAQLLGDRTLELSLGACNAEKNEATVTEDESSVTVRVVSTNPSEGEDCADGVTVELDEPLGDRELIDATTGAHVEVTAES
jgi:hypothetical protein